MDLGGLKGGQYQAIKSAKKVNDFAQATRKKAKSIGSSSDYAAEDMKDEVQSVKSKDRKGRSKSGGGDEPLLRRKKTGSIGSKSNGDATSDGGDIEKKGGSGKKQYK